MAYSRVWFVTCLKSHICYGFRYRGFAIATKVEQGFGHSVRMKAASSRQHALPNREIIAKTYCAGISFGSWPRSMRLWQTLNSPPGLRPKARDASLEAAPRNQEGTCRPL